MMLQFGSRKYHAPEGTGGGDGDGSGDGAQFGPLAEGADASTEQGTVALDYLGKTEGFDAKAYEGKSPTDIYLAAHQHETKARSAADPFKGTPFEGQKIPDKFVVEKDGKKVVATDKLIKSYGELERSAMRRRDEIAAELSAAREEGMNKTRPAAPGDYVAGEKVKVTGEDGKEREAFTLKIGERTVEVLQADPALAFIKQVAHKHGVPQDEFQEIVKGYIMASFATGPKWSDEAKALGGDTIAEKREQRVVSFLKGNLSDENYKWFAQQPSTASGIKAIEQLMELTGMPGFIPEKGDVPGETYSREDLAAMQRDPRYTGERQGGVDKNFVKLVRSGFQKLARAGA
jgi:hypothetical protein